MNCKICITQDSDCEGPGDDEGNFLEVDSNDCGGGVYLTLKTDRWALDIDDIDEFAEELKRIYRILNETHSKFKK